MTGNQLTLLLAESLLFPSSPIPLRSHVSHLNYVSRTAEIKMKLLTPNRETQGLHMRVYKEAGLLWIFCSWSLDFRKKSKK